MKRNIDNELISLFLSLHILRMQKKAIYYLIKELICYDLHVEWHFHSNGFWAHLLRAGNGTTFHSHIALWCARQFTFIFIIVQCETVTDYPLCNPKDQKVKTVCIVFTVKCTTLPSKINENLLCSHSIHLWACIKKRSKKHKEDSFSQWCM